MATWGESDKFIMLAIIPKVTGFASIVGSCCILFDIFRKENNRRPKLKITTNRIVAIMSICDVMSSFIGHFLSTWMIPENLPVWQASGNQQTCTFQGFVTTFAVFAGTLLNAALAVTYVLIVRRGWKDEALQKPILSFLLLLAPVLVSLGLHLWPLATQSYVWTGSWTCWQMKGHDSILVGMIIGMVCFCVIFGATLVMYWTVLVKERAMDRFAVDGQVNRTQSNRVAWQGIWYSGSYFFAWFFYWVAVIWVRVGDRPFWILVVIAFTMPTQGFFTAIVYFRPRWASQRRRQAQTSSRQTQASSGCEPNSSSSLRQSRFARRFWGIFSTRSSSTGKSTAMTSTAVENTNPNEGMDNTNTGVMSGELALEEQ